MVSFSRAARLGLCLAYLLSCTGASKMEKTAERSDEDFQKVAYPGYGECACSPAVTQEFRGLRIRVPRKVKLPASGPAPLDPKVPWLPVCGVVRLPAEEVEKLGVHPIKGLVLVFVDRATGKPVSFNLQPDKPEAPPARELPPDMVSFDDLPEEQIDRSLVYSRHFAIDAMMFCPEFPRGSSRYRVHALLGKHKSNVVEVEVEAE
jgi:hypothetical protein